jgi:hypothetical protein
MIPTKYQSHDKRPLCVEEKLPDDVRKANLTTVMRRRRKKTDVDHGLQMPSAKTQADHLLKFHIHNAKLTTSKKFKLTTS